MADPYHLPEERVAGPLVGELVSGCMVEAAVAEDTFNTFFRAFDEEAETPVLFRVLRPEWVREARHVSEALRLEMIAAGLNHPHLLAATRAAEDLRRGIRYAILPQWSLRTLKDRVEKEGPLLPRETALLGSLLADGLARLHDLGILHLAVCPVNVLLDEEGTPALKGFECARFVPGDEALPLLMRSPCHLAPEQAEGRMVDERSDVYLLGGSLRFALSGRSAGPALDAVLERACAEAPDDRHGNCRELCEDLDRLLGPEAPDHQLSGLPRRAPRRKVSTPWRVPEYEAVQEEIREALLRPKDDWLIEDWRRENPSSRATFRPATYHRDNQIALVFLKRYSHDARACEAHLERYRWMGEFLAAHLPELDRRGMVVGDEEAQTFGIRRAVLDHLVECLVEDEGAPTRAALNALLRKLNAPDAAEGWVAVDPACFPTPMNPPLPPTRSIDPNY